MQIGKKSPTKLESLCDVEKALSESRDSASAVSTAIFNVFRCKDRYDHAILTT